MAIFVKRTDGYVDPGHHYEDKLIKVYALVDKVEKVGNDEFVSVKVPEVVDSYHMSKRIQEEAKGSDLKSIIKRVEQTGDISLLNSRTPVYGDSSIIPTNTGEAYQKALDDAKALNSLSKDDLDLVAKCKDKTPEEIQKIVADYISQHKQKDPEPEPAPVPGGSEGN